MPDDTHDLTAHMRQRGAVPLAGMLAQLHAAAASFKPGKDCREDIQTVIAAVDAALGGANA